MMRRIGRMCAALAASIFLGFAIYDTAEQRRLERRRQQLRAERGINVLTDAHQDGAR